MKKWKEPKVWALGYENITEEKMISIESWSTYY